MSNIQSNGKFQPFQTDLKKLEIVKARTRDICPICKNSIPNRSISLGKSGSGWYSRICLDCADKFLNNFIKSVEEFKQIGIEVLKDIKKNEKEYKAINTTAKI